MKNERTGLTQLTKNRKKESAKKKRKSERKKERNK